MKLFTSIFHYSFIWRQRTDIVNLIFISHHHQCDSLQQIYVTLWKYRYSNAKHEISAMSKSIPNRRIVTGTKSNQCQFSKSTHIKYVCYTAPYANRCCCCHSKIQVLHVCPSCIRNISQHNCNRLCGAL